MPRVPRPRLPRRLDHGEEASLVEHLDELRARMFVCIGAIAVGVVVGFVIHNRLIHYLVLTLPKNHRQITTLTIGEPFMTSLWVSIWFGVIVAMPVILWQTWSFFIPAVEQSHALLMRWFALLAAVLLVVGMVFGYFVALPAAEHFLTNYDNQTYHIIIQAKPFITFAVEVLFAMGIVFELPLFVVGLTRLGILTTAKLRRTRRAGYFIVACVGVALPGVDPVTTMIETVPLWVLYEMSIWLSVLLDRRSTRLKAAALET